VFDYPGPNGLLRRFEAVIHSRETAFRLIARDVEKLTFLLADGAGLRGGRFDNRIAAIAALPGIFGKRCFIFRHGLFSLTDVIMKFIIKSAWNAIFFSLRNILEIPMRFR
jgi:hypothetical protein